MRFAGLMADTRAVPDSAGLVLNKRRICTAFLVLLFWEVQHVLLPVFRCKADSCVPVRERSIAWHVDMGSLARTSSTSAGGTLEFEDLDSLGAGK
jgi:hypothetical protein